MRPTGAQPDATTLAPDGFNVSLASSPFGVRFALPSPSVEDCGRHRGTHQPHRKAIHEAQEEPVAPVDVTILVELALWIVVPRHVHGQRCHDDSWQDTDEGCSSQ